MRLPAADAPRAGRDAGVRQAILPPPATGADASDDPRHVYPDRRFPPARLGRAGQGAAVRYAGADRLYGRPVVGRGAAVERCRPPHAAGVDGQDDDDQCRLRADRPRRSGAQQDVHGAAGNLAEMAWPAGRIDHVPLPGEQVSVENLLHGIVTLSGNDASVVLAECIAGTEEAFANVMNENAQAAWPDQQPVRQFERLAGRGADLCHRARPRDAGPGRDREPSPALQEVLQPDELHLGQDARLGRRHHPGQSQSPAWPGAGRRRAQDRPHRRGGLWLHRIGRAERPPAGDGHRRARQLQPADRGIGAADAMGLQRLAGQAVVQGRARRSAAPRSSWAATAKSRWSRRATWR